MTMTNPETWTPQQFRAYVGRQYGLGAAPVFRTVNAWLARGDGAAVYENQDLGHPDLGLCQITSFGSPAAQLETEYPPERLPDTPRHINWRYILVATYRGDQITDGDGDHDDRPNGDHSPRDGRDRPAAG